MLARCPNCRATFSTERSGQQICPACQKPLIVPEQPVLAASLPEGRAQPGFPRFGEVGSDGPEPQAAGTPWERRPELPAFQAWWQTMTLALFEPNKLFGLARLDKMGEQTSFALVTFSVFSIVGQLLEQLLIGPQQDRWVAQLKETFADRVPPALLKLLENGQHRSLGMTLLALCFAPLVAFVFIYVNAGVTHLCAMVFGQNRRGFAATFAACAYAMAPAVLFAVPGCGSLVALVWTIVLTGIGLKRTHGLSNGGATAAALGPYLIFCCGGCAIFMIMATVASNLVNSGIN